MQEPFGAPSSTTLTAAAPSSAELVRRCLRGDADAWGALVERYARLVRSIPARQGFSPAEVDDVGQEVFLALAQNLHAIEDAERLPGWLVTTTRRICWRLQARRHSERPLDEFTGENDDERTVHRELISPLPTPEEALAGWQRQEAIQQALEQLGERCRQLLILIFLDPNEPSYEEISAQLDMPKGSIGPTRNRCLQQLRSRLAGSEQEL
jgi:RNA polymerase sigma factor (sigma-70 family)